MHDFSFARMYPTQDFMHAKPFQVYAYILKQFCVHKNLHTKNYNLSRSRHGLPSMFNLVSFLNKLQIFCLKQQTPKSQGNKQ